MTLCNHKSFSRKTVLKKKLVPGENSYSEAAKSKMNSQNIRIFPDSIAKGIRAKQFNQFVKTENT